MSEINLEHQRLDNFHCSEYYFSSNFDSGNLGKVEISKIFTDQEFEETGFHKEFNVWTTPDCYGTNFQSPNRTWFFFAIRGGRANEVIKINVKNLNRQSKLFNNGMAPVMRIGRTGKWERIKDKPTYQTELDNFTIGFLHNVQDRFSIETFYAFTYPFTYTECQNILEKFTRKNDKKIDEINLIAERINFLQLQENNLSATNNRKKNEQEYNKIKNELSILQNEIYFHRELLVNSLENRRVDLITISSFHNIEDQLEDKIPNLFPDTEERRCHVFKNKKIIFLSSRVHPGETCSSFVLNGFLHLLLDKKNQVASTLRRMYVFKIVPILNPDGVFRGFYRTDTLGQNLNRFYVNTSFERHPSIYAVKKIIKLYQFGLPCALDSDDDNIEDITEDNTESSSNDTNSDEIKICGMEQNAVKENMSTDTIKESGISNNFSSESDEELIPSTSKKIIMEVPPGDFANNSMENALNIKKKTELQPIPVVKKRISHSRLIKDKSSLLLNIDNNLKENTLSSQHFKQPLKKNILKSKSVGSSKLLHNFSKSSMSSKKINLNNNVETPLTHHDKNSNLFLYIDMHGHASKKGVFMYGNHFSNTYDAIECMLLPKLMSINCHHFHYDACNFSEKNMYKREKRDGLSKEGSGRVAVYKITGLLKCYTLECNYNCGRYVNILAPRANHMNSATINANPPKYTPHIFEEVGKALGPSILDITNSNTDTRVINSDFRTLQGVRLSIRHEIDRSAPRTKLPTSLNKIPNSSRTQKNFCVTSSSNPRNETAKENKEYHHNQIYHQTLPTMQPTTSTAENPNKMPLKFSRNIKKQSSFKIRPSNLYGKLSNASSSAGATITVKKKHKVLGETSLNSAKKNNSNIVAIPSKKPKISNFNKNTINKISSSSSSSSSARKNNVASLGSTSSSLEISPTTTTSNTNSSSSSGSSSNSSSGSSSSGNSSSTSNSNSNSSSSNSNSDSTNNGNIITSNINEPKASTSSSLYENLPINCNNNINNNNNNATIVNPKSQVSGLKTVNSSTNFNLKKNENSKILCKKKRIARYETSVLKRKKKQLSVNK